MIIDNQTPLKIALTAFDHSLFINYIKSSLAEHWIGKNHNDFVISQATVYSNNTVYPSNQGWYKGIVEIISQSELNLENDDQDFIAPRQYCEIEFGLADADGFPVPVYKTPKEYIGGIRFVYVNWSYFLIN